MCIRDRVSDVTEFRLPDDGRKVYLSPVVDLFDGKPVGWPFFRLFLPVQTCLKVTG